MLRRYTTIITNQGMDAAIPMIDDPNIISDYRIKSDQEYKHKLAIFYGQFALKFMEDIFERGYSFNFRDDGSLESAPIADRVHRDFIDKIKEEQQQDLIEFSKSHSGVEPMAYKMFQLRAQYAGDVRSKPVFAIDDKDFDRLRSMGGEIAAFHILDGLIKGYTDFGRFDNGPKRKVFIMNKMADDDRFNRKNDLKKLRREFFNRINELNDDGDEI